MPPSSPYQRLAREVGGRLSATTRPVLVGIGGGVGVGKSTAARELAAQLRQEGIVAEVLGTDAFLLPNDELARRGLLMRKGFPESFDEGAIERALRSLREQALPVRVPVYSHTSYDRVPGAEQVLRGSDAVLVEGVNACQDPLRRWLDLCIYIDVPEPVMEAWYVERFLQFCESAEEDEGSFYRVFNKMTPDQRADTAREVWRQVNGVNLALHILPSRDSATFVLEKEPDHSTRSLLRQG